MNKTLTTTADRNVSYRSPEVSVTEITNEGVLCVSSLKHEGWIEEDLNW